VTLLHRAGRIEDRLGVAVGAVEHHHVHARAHELVRALDVVGAHADRRAHAEPAQVVLARARVADPLLDVLHGDEAAEVEIPVHDRELLDPVLMEGSLRLLQRRPDRSRDEVVLCHHLRS
jgi:hypothetical protein